MGIKEHLYLKYQNCNVFNDGAFFGMTDKATKMNQTLFLENGNL